MLESEKRYIIYIKEGFYMEQINLKKIKLLDKLKLIPDNKLDGIIDYIEFILSKFNI